MKEGVGHGSLDAWARQSLGISPYADFRISDDEARKILAQIEAERESKDRPFMDKPFLILVAAYGRQMRGILGAKLKIWAELPDEENKFWLKVVQNAGKYKKGKAPVVHWLAKMAKNQARNALRSQIRRTKWVAYRMSTEVEMRNAEEYADERTLTPDEVLAQEELAKEAHRVVTSFLGSVDEKTSEVIIRNKVDGITFEALAKRTGKAGKALLRLRISRAYRKMRKRVPPDLRRALVHVYRGGDLEYAKKQYKEGKVDYYADNERTI